MNMNPLVLAYQERLGRHASVARDAYTLLVTALHEAGHWVGTAHFGVHTQIVEIDRRPGHAYRGYYRASDYVGFVEPEAEKGVDYVSTMAGPLAQYLFDPVRRGKKDSAQDLEDGREILASIAPEARGAFDNQWVRRVDVVVRDNWPVIEAFAYELLRHGSFRWGKANDIEARYGLGYGARGLSTARQASARKRLADFHSTPEELKRAIATCSAVEHQF